jgi:U3 small nucleolar ribonucleoprotein component
VISEEHYAEFAMGEEYQALYGDMVNRLMIMRRHYGEIADDYLRTMNLPNTREIDTMQERLQQVRRDNFALKKEIREIKAMLKQMNSRPEPAAKKAPAVKATPAAKKMPPVKKTPAVKTKPAALKAPAAKKAPVRKKAVASKTPASKTKVTTSKAGA